MFRAILAILRLLKKPVVVEHYLSYVSHRELSANFPLFLDRWSYRLVDRIITHSDEMQNEISNTLQVPHRKMTSFYCAVDLDQFSPTSSAKPGLMNRIQGRFAVFYHGMAHPWHGLDVLLEAAALLESSKDIVFIILVPGVKVKDQSNIIYIDAEKPFNELPPYLAAAQLWCSGTPMIRAATALFPLTMIQAMAMGLPVITSPSHDKSRHLRDGENVLFVAPKDARALAARIEECYDNPLLLARIGQAARATAEQRFNLASAEDYLITLFQNPGQEI